MTLRIELLDFGLWLKYTPNMDLLLNILFVLTVLGALALAGKFSVWEHRKTPEEYASELHEKRMNAQALSRTRS